MVTSPTPHSWQVHEMRQAISIEQDEWEWTAVSATACRVPVGRYIHQWQGWPMKVRFIILLSCRLHCCADLCGTNLKQHQRKGFEESRGSWCHAVRSTWYEFGSMRGLWSGMHMANVRCTDSIHVQRFTGSEDDAKKCSSFLCEIKQTGCTVRRY